MSDIEARMLHEAVRAYWLEVEPSNPSEPHEPSWDDAPERLRDAALRGIRMAATGRGVA